MPAAIWNSLEIAKLLVSLLMPVLVVIVGYWFDRRLKEIELENQRRSQLVEQENQRRIQQYAEEQQRIRDEAERENQRRNQHDEKEQQRIRDEIERRRVPHIEFAIACNVYGAQQGWYIAEFVISAKNVSLVRHQFTEIILRVRGIKQNETPVLWEGRGYRLEFKHKLLETDLVPEDLNYLFVEPGVNQEISFITRIEEDYRYIVAFAEFRYDYSTPHSVERMFELGPRSVVDGEHQ